VQRRDGVGQLARRATVSRSLVSSQDVEQPPALRECAAEPLGLRELLPLDRSPKVGARLWWFITAA
jgi:hypothetical protein